MFGLDVSAAFWIIALVAFLALEAFTAGLTSIWFAVGALAALITALLHGPLWLQVVWFVVVSALMLIFTRPLAKKYVNGRTVATNADRSIGKTAVTIERIDNVAGTGAVKLDGVEWTARSLGEETIEAGKTVRVCEIRGVRLIVEPLGEK